MYKILQSLIFPVDGFQTLPAPFPVKANIGVAALEGDISISGDSFQFKASSSANYTVLSDAINEQITFLILVFLLTVFII